MSKYLKMSTNNKFYGRIIISWTNLCEYISIRYLWGRHPLYWNSL